MTREQTETLLEELGGHGAFVADDHGGMPPLPAKKAALVLLWTLANQDTIRSIADRFDVTKSSIIRTNRRLTSVLVGPMLQEHIKWPVNEDASLAMCPTGMWKMVGAIDGSHIPISQPVENQEAYVNRKGFHSIILQAVCQADMKFIDVFAGYPGSVHDARVFRNSPLSELLPQLCGDDYFIAGDSAYPLSGQLVTPFRDNGRLTRQQKKFNTEFSRRRVVVERAFALLKGRFRRLKFLKMWGIADTVRTIIAACVLHNMCLSGGDDGADCVDCDDERDCVVEDDEAAAAAVGGEERQVVGQDAVAFRERLMAVLLAGDHL